MPVIGELRYGFQKSSQTKQNESELVRFLASPNVQVLSPTLQTSEHYAQIALVCQKQGRALSQNDIWIAAIAKENNAPLVTFDKDFAILQDFLSDRLIVLSHQQ